MYPQMLMMYGMWESRASNHMTYHGEWFRDVKNLERPGYGEFGDDTAHPITHIRNVPLSMQDRKVKYLSWCISCTQHYKIHSFYWTND